jgi:selenocysteine lyase/cysteine desulfurase
VADENRRSPGEANRSRWQAAGIRIAHAIAKPTGDQPHLMMTRAEHPQGVDWAAWREQFPGLKKSTYLNTVSLGQLSNRSRAAIDHFMDLWTEHGASAWYANWLDEVAGLRQEFARLIGATAEEVAIMPNVSSALAAISSSLDFSNRNQVICCELDFPTLTYHWLAKAQLGVETVILPSPDSVQIPIEAFEAAINEHTALVATSRVYFTTGYVQDVKALADRVHRKDCLLLVDDYQGTGQVPIDVKESGVDVLITGGLKWLIGGPGVAYMYVNRDRIPDLRPNVTGWFSHARQFDFDPQQLEFRSDAARFEAGTPSVASVYAGKAGLEIVNEIGSLRIQRRTMALAQDLTDRLMERGFQLRLPPRTENRSGITIVEADDPMGITRKLAERRIVVDKRPGAVRISPYFYNTPAENQIVVEALSEIMPS